MYKLCQHRLQCVSRLSRRYISFVRLFFGVHFNVVFIPAHFVWDKSACSRPGIRTVKNHRGAPPYQHRTFSMPCFLCGFMKYFNLFSKFQGKPRSERQELVDSKAPGPKKKRKIACDRKKCILIFITHCLINLSLENNKMMPE